MLKNGFVHAAVTAATIANFLAAEADKKNIQQHSSRQNKKRQKKLESALRKLKYKR